MFQRKNEKSEAELDLTSGSIYLHCDPNASHYLKQVMDNVFGIDNYRNEIVWSYNKVANSRAKKYLRAHDTILFYSQSSDFVYNVSYDSELSPRKRQLVRAGYNTKRMGGKHYLYIYDEEKAEGKVNRDDFDIVRTVDVTHGNRHADVFEINFLNSQSADNVGYPTQKPVELLERIIKVSTHE